MNKKSIIIILLVVLFAGAIISLYSTFAYSEESTSLEESIADYNLIYSIKENSSTELNVAANEEKYVDITLYNPYNSTVKYGMYYYLMDVDFLPPETVISLAEESIDSLEDTIKPNQTRIVSIKVSNNADFPVGLEIGAIVGFENGNIEDLVQDGEILIK